MVQRRAECLKRSLKQLWVSYNLSTWQLQGSPGSIASLLNDILNMAHVKFVIRDRYAQQNKIDKLMSLKCFQGSTFQVSVFLSDSSNAAENR